MAGDEVEDNKGHQMLGEPLMPSVLQRPDENRKPPRAGVMVRLIGAQLPQDDTVPAVAHSQRGRRSAGPQIQGTVGTSPRAPYERTLRALIVLSVVLLAVIDLLPFYVNLRGQLWDQVLGYEGSYDTPVGFAAGILCFIVVLVAAAGGRAQRQALGSCPILLRPEKVVHGVNVLLLAGVIPWWIKQDDADTSDLFDGWGFISGAACKWMMGLCLLPIARQSLWLDTAAAGFPEGVGFHRVTGWWCVAQVVIHSVCYTVTEALEATGDCADWKRQHTHGNHNGHNHTTTPEAAGEFDGTKCHAIRVALEVYFWPWASRLNMRTGKPEPNTVAVFILVGLVGTLAAIALAVFSLPRLRRARYDLFYLVHVPTAALFIGMGAIHEFEMMTFVVPGLFAYFLDRTDYLNRTATSRFHRVTARLRVLTADWVRLDLMCSPSTVTSSAAYGTQFMYLRVPVLGGESHAFSLAARCPSIVIKANGDWTRRLYQLAQKQAVESLRDFSAGSSVEKQEHSAIPPQQLSSVTTDLTCEIDGVYGNASPPWRSYSHVLFIGGGVGVAPWIPAVEEHQEMCRLHRATAQTMRLVWCGRTRAELDAMGPYLPEDTTVFLTRAAADEVESKPPDDSSGSDDDGSGGTPAVMPRPPPRDTSALQHDPGVAADMEPRSGTEGLSTTSTQNAVGRSGTRPWLFAFVGVLSLCLTQISYYYFRGVHSVYVDYENFEGKPTLTQYLLARALPVACGFVAIAAATIFGRWAANLMSASMKCLCVASRAGVGMVTGAQRVALQPQPRPAKIGRPDMTELVEAAVAEAEAMSPSSASSITTGLFVCVCGPGAMVKSCKDAVRRARRRHRGLAIGLHAEEPDW